jgi:CDP-diglyceride synthetase
MSYPSLISRLKTASILVGIVIVLMIASSFGGIWAWGLIISCYVFVVLSALELQYACLHNPLHQSRFGSLVSRSVLVGAMLLPATIMLLVRIDFEGYIGLATPEKLLPFLLYISGLSLFIILIPVLFQARESIEEIERKVLERMIAVLLVGMGGGGLVSIASLSDAPWLFLWTVTMVGCNDSAAYFVGAKIKTPPISPVLSPKKTVLGSAAGLIGGTIVGVLLAFVLPLERPGWLLFFSGILCLNIIAQLGDLLSSLIKRVHGLKDMGTILPGHGGILDRIDGLLLASPIALALLVVVRGN